MGIPLFDKSGQFIITKIEDVFCRESGGRRASEAIFFNQGVLWVQDIATVFCIWV